MSGRTFFGHIPNFCIETGNVETLKRLHPTSAMNPSFSDEPLQQLIHSAQGVQDFVIKVQTFVQEAPDGRELIQRHCSVLSVCFFDQDPEQPLYFDSQDTQNPTLELQVLFRSLQLQEFDAYAVFRSLCPPTMILQPHLAVWLTRLVAAGNALAALFVLKQPDLVTLDKSSLFVTLSRQLCIDLKPGVPLSLNQSALIDVLLSCLSDTRVGFFPHSFVQIAIDRVAERPILLVRFFEDCLCVVQQHKDRSFFQFRGFETLVSQLRRVMAAVPYTTIRGSLCAEFPVLFVEALMAMRRDAFLDSVVADVRKYVSMK